MGGERGRESSTLARNEEQAPDSLAMSGSGLSLERLPTLNEARLASRPGDTHFQHPVPGVVKKPLSRLELETSPLPRECSTAELQGHVWMGRVGFEPT